MGHCRLTFLDVCLCLCLEPDSANLTTSIRFLRGGWGVRNRDRISRYDIGYMVRN